MGIDNQIGDSVPSYEIYRRGYDSKWIFVNSISHPVNRYNNELIQYSKIINNYEQSPYTNMDYTYLKCSVDAKNMYIKSLGSFDNPDFMSIYDSAQFLFERNYEEGDNKYEFRYKIGLGEIYYKNEEFEWGEERELTAYRKGNDTTGIFTEDAFFSAIQEHESQEIIQVYANPVKDILYVNLKNGQLPDEIDIIGLNGLIIRTTVKSNRISVLGL